MKKLRIAIITALLIFVFACPAQAVKIYRRTLRTGGTTAAMDGVNGASLNDGDICYINESNYLYTYYLDADLGVAESNPQYIVPDTNPGSKVWVLQNSFSANNSNLMVRVLGSPSCTTLAEAIAISGNYTLLVNSDYTMSADANIPARIAVDFDGSGGPQITLGAYNLSINNFAYQGLRQVFNENSTGNVSFGSGAYEKLLPQWWGATGDGTTDDQAALNACVAAGEYMHLIKGTYLISDKIYKATGDSMRVTADPEAVIKYKSTFPNGSSTAGLYFNGIPYVRVTGVEIDGDNDTLGYSDWHNYIYGIYIKDANQAIVDHCRIYDYPSNAILFSDCNSVYCDYNEIRNGIYHGISVQTCYDSHISKNKIFGTGDQGTDPNTGGLGILVTKGHRAYITENRIENMSDTGTKTEGTYYVVYDKNHVEDSGKDGIKVQNYTGVSEPQYSWITNNTVKYIHYWRTDGGSLILCQEASNCTIENNIVIGGEKESGDENGIKVKGDAGGSNRPDNVIVSKNQIIDVITADIVTSQCNENIQILNNLCANQISTSTTYGKLTIKGNTVHRATLDTSNAAIHPILYADCELTDNILVNGDYGILAQPNANINHISITNNKVLTSSESGIRIENYTGSSKTVENIDIRGNDLYEINTSSPADRGGIDISINDLVIERLSVDRNYVDTNTEPTNGFLYLRSTGTDIAELYVNRNYMNGDEEATIDPNRVARYTGRPFSSAAPASGTWRVNDIVYDSSVTAGENIGWICTTAGTPGTWKEFGIIDLAGSITWDPGNLADAGGETSSSITVTGAALGDYCICSAPYDLQDMTATCYVQAANTVEIRLQNESGSSHDLAEGSWKVKIIK